MKGPTADCRLAKPFVLLQSVKNSLKGAVDEAGCESGL